MCLFIYCFIPRIVFLNNNESCYWRKIATDEFHFFNLLLREQLEKYFNRKLYYYDYGHWEIRNVKNCTGIETMALTLFTI